MIILSSNGLKINNESVDFNIIQPSSPITKNKKTGETLDLGAHPNAQIECELSNALVVTKTYACEFEYDGHQYNFNAKVVNQVHTSEDKYNVSLQAVGKVIVGGKSTTPTISYDNTTFTVSASGDGEVKMYVDGVETVSPHTFDAVGTYVVTATAEQDGKAISDTVTENITIAKTATPTISYDDSTYTVSASGNGTVTMYVDGVATVSPHTFTQGADDVTYTVTATAIETGKFLSDTVTENCLVPAASQPEGTIYTISYNDASGASFTATDYTIEKDPVVITSHGAYGSTLGYFATNNNSNISFEAGGATISNIDFIFYEDERNGTSTLTPDSGTFTNNYLVDKTGNWSGSATSVTMTSSGGFKYIEIRVTVINSQPEPTIPTCDNTITLNSTNSFGGDEGEDTNGVIMGCKSVDNQPGWQGGSQQMRWVGKSEGTSPNIKFNFCPIAYDFNSALNIRKMSFCASGSKAYGYDTAAECEGRLEAVDLSSYYEDKPDLEYLHVHIDELTPYQLSNGKYVPQYEITIYVDDNDETYSAWDGIAQDALQPSWDDTPIFLLSYNRGDGNGTGNWLYLGELANDGTSDYYDNQQIYVGYNNPAQE